MAAMRRLPQYIANLKHGVWQQSGLKSASMPSNFGVGQALNGKTLGVWGYGRIGRLVAGYGRAFGMQVTVWGSEASRHQAQQDGFVPAPGAEAFFEACDVLSLHLRLTDEARGVVKLDALTRMKPTALLVNTSRGPIVDEDALLAALHEGAIAGAALDVYDVEPLPRDHPLREAPRTLLSPHLGYVTTEHYARFYGDAVEDIAAWMRGEPVRVLE
jgi:D-3-phosphoglycerate dehydrogenase